MAGQQLGLGLGADGLAPALDQIGRAQQVAQGGVVDSALGVVLNRVPPDAVAGVGSTSMRERAEETGGSCAVEPAPPRPPARSRG